MNTTNRKTEHEISEIFLKRWSPRAMSGKPIKKDDLMILFEAAKWAPSSYNNQPWRFIYALKDTKHWDLLFNLLGDFNKQWCKNASALVVIISKNKFDHNNQPSITHSFDSGAAWENLALQASMTGFVVHGMQGFDYEKARKDLEIPEDYDVEMMFVIGLPGEKEDISKELQEKENPSDRKQLKEIVFEGKFKE